MNDTSLNYEHLIDYVAEENLNKGSLDSFFDPDEKEYRPEVRKRDVNPEFPEEWQTLQINILTFEDYVDFMDKLGLKATPKLKKMVYENPENAVNIFDFVE